MDERLKILNRFVTGIVDINITRNPLHSEVSVVFNDAVLDQYQDSIVKESCRVKKYALVRKNVDMSYVQELGDILLEDTDQLPWMVGMSMTGLPRIPKFNDYIILDNVKYTISAVKPFNRQIDSIIWCFIYPERTDFTESLEIISVTPFVNGFPLENIPLDYDKLIVLDILYKGFPTEYSFDGITWKPFRSRIPFFLNSEFGACKEVNAQDAFYIHSTDLNGGVANMSDEEGHLSEIDGGLPYTIYYTEANAQDSDNLIEGGDAYSVFNINEDMHRYFVEFDGGNAFSTFATIFLRDKEGHICKKDL